MKKIITLDEFFTYKEMFQGLPEDQALACELYNNADYENKDIIDTLMAKALMFKSRLDFCKAVKYSYVLPTFTIQEIYVFIEKQKVDGIYMEILKKIRDE